MKPSALCLDCGHSAKIKQVSGCLDHPVLSLTSKKMLLRTLLHYEVLDSALGEVIKGEEDPSRKAALKDVRKVLYLSAKSVTNDPNDDKDKLEGTIYEILS